MAQNATWCLHNKPAVFSMSYASINISLLIFFSSCWGGRLQKAESSVISSWIRIKFGTNVFQVACIKLTELDCWFFSRWRPSHQCGCRISSIVHWLPTSPPSASGIFGCLYMLQFLIHSTFTLCYAQELLFCKTLYFRCVIISGFSILISHCPSVLQVLTGPLMGESELSWILSYLQNSWKFDAHEKCVVNFWTSHKNFSQNLLASFEWESALVKPRFLRKSF